MAELIEVSDPADPRLGDYVRLRDSSLRRHLEVEQGIFIAEGEKIIARVLDKGLRPRSFLLAERWLAGLASRLAAHPATPVYVVSEQVAEDVTGFHVHRGALGAFERPPLPSLAEFLARLRRQTANGIDPVSGASMAARTERCEPRSGPRRSRIAVLEDLVDHSNVGACFRSAAALGLDAVLVTPRCADPLYRRSIKVSMGTVFQVPWTRVNPWPESIEMLKQTGYVVAGMTLGDGAVALDELVAENHSNLALVFGTEGHGLTPRADRLLDRRVTIPMMHGVDSLNVAASSAVAFYATG